MIEVSYTITGCVLLLIAIVMIVAAIMRPDDDMETIYECSGCGQEIDPDVCHCGEMMDKHGYGAGHGPIPMGCDCGRSG